MTAFSHKVHKCPPFLALLEITDFKAGQLRSAEPAANQKGEHGSIAFAAQGMPVRRIEQEPCLLLREPIARAMPQLLDSFDTTDARNQFRAKEPSVRSFIREPPNGRQAYVYRGWSQPETFQVLAVREDDRTIQ